MAVIMINEVHIRNGGYDVEKGRSIRRWNIKVDSAYDDDQTIGAELVGGSLPMMYSPHPNNYTLTCRSIHIDHVSGLIWTATATYTNEPIDQKNRDKSENPNPADRPVIVSSQAEEIMVAAVRDKDGKAILNSANDPFDPPPVEPTYEIVYNFEKNYVNIPSYYYTYLRSVNKASIKIEKYGTVIEAKRAKFLQPRISEEKREGDYIFYTVSWQVRTMYSEDDEDNYQPRYLDQGLREIVDNGFAKAAIVDDEGVPVSSPVCLDGEGKKLTNPTPDNAVYIRNNWYYELDYTVLPGIVSGA